MKKNFQFEEIRLYSIFSFMFMSLMYIGIFTFLIPLPNMHYNYFIAFLITIIIFTIYNLVRYYYLNTIKFPSSSIFLLYGCIDLFYVNYYFDIPALDQGGKIVIMFLLLISSIYRGRKIGIILTLLWFPIKLLSNFIFIHFVINMPSVNFNDVMTYIYLMDSIYFQIMLLLFVFIMNVIYKKIVSNEKENKNLFNKLKHKYIELNFANDQIEAKNDRLKKANDDLEELNDKLKNSIAEFFTMQQITNAIGTILNMDELMKYVNDILLGVMGVKGSSIILLNEDEKKLEVHTTNITNKNDYEHLSNNINDTALIDILNSGNLLYDNNLDENRFSFTSGRNVKSIICVPISCKFKKFGLILLEQNFVNAFDENKIRLLTVIAQQIGVAMENADLYNKMQELAIKDNLTGVYNRMYLHKRLEEEFKTAKASSYELSLAMLDIDYFKRFNDTYGHLFGDKVLKSISNAIGESIRDVDIAARFGGEEFVIIFPNTSLAEAYEIIEILRQNIKHTTLTEKDVCVSVTASFGLANFPNTSFTTIDLLKDADDALYEAKNSGRNCVKTAKKISFDNFI